MARLSSMIRPTLLALGLVACLGMAELQEHQQEHQDVHAQIESNPLRSVNLSSEKLEVCINKLKTGKQFLSHRD